MSNPWFVLIVAVCGDDVTLPGSVIMAVIGVWRGVVLMISDISGL